MCFQTVWVKMTERAKIKEFTNFTFPRSFLPDLQFFLFIKRGPRGISWPFWIKEAERGWKSEAGPLSWKSGWKPLISWWFWAIGSYCIFFPFRDMAILKCPLGRIKFPMLKYGPVECLIWGMFQWAKQAFIGTVITDFFVYWTFKNSHAPTLHSWKP